MWKELFEKIKDYNYIVQRNWEHLPNFSKEHDDLDLFVHSWDYEKVKAIADQYPRVDVRHPGDRYYPSNIAGNLLENRVWHPKGFWIPCPTMHFLSLYYHNLVHKQGNPYEKKLQEVFLEAFPPVKCKDQGVGYYV